MNELYIERCGEEDATLRQTVAGGSPRILEIQIKSTTTRIGAREVAEILLAFPRGSAEDCLLSRLSSDTSRLCLIFSGGSPADSVASLEAVVSLLNETSPRPPLSKVHAIELQTALRSVSHASKTLGKRRKEYGHALVQRLGIEGLRSLTKRIYIFPRYTSAYVLSEISETLATKFLVPKEAANELADEALRRVVEAARDSRENCVAALHKKAGDSSADRISPRLPYVPHQSELALRRQLRDESYILLTGLPLCGKTQLAKALASHLQEQAVHARLFDTMAEAARFLLDPASGESRAALIEDPFGKIQLSPDARESWSRLTELIDQLPAARRLIVTTRSDILSLIHGSAEASDWVAAKHPWHILDNQGESRLVDVWNAWAESQGRNAEEQKEFSARLTDSPVLSSLEPGHAAFLALRRDKDYRKLADSEIASLARRECEDLSRELLSLGQHVARILRAMSASCSTVHGPTEATLAFIAEDKSEDRPGRRRKSSFEGFDELPKCDQNRTLSDSSLLALEQLEERGVVERNGATHRFSHPLWEEAGRRSLSGKSLSATRYRREALSKALFSGDIVSGENAVATLAWFCANQASYPHLHGEVLSLLEDASECVFPRVSDMAMSILLQNLEHLPIPRRKHAVRIATRSTHSSRQLKWSGTVAWLPTNTDSYDLGREHQRLALLESSVAELLPRRPKDLSPSQLLAVVEQFDGPHAGMTGFLEYGLHADESTIRARAALALARYCGEARPDLVDRALSDPHPAVVCSTMIGLGLSWHLTSNVNREHWQTRLDERLRSVGFGLAALYSLTSFRQWAGWSSEWYSARKGPWHFWTRCTQAALSSDPGYFGINDAHLYDLAQQAMQHIHEHEVVAFCESWQEWLERRLRHGYASDYAAGAGEILLQNTTWRASGRRSLIRRLTSQTDTTVQCILIRDILFKWRSLSPAERTLFANCILADRPDSEWLLSTALLDGLTPSFLLRRLNLSPNLFSLAPDQVFRTLPPALCHHILSLFCGHPGVLCATGLHHLNEKFWLPVLWKALYDTGHPSFHLAVRELVRRASDDAGLLRHWERLCRCGDEETLQALFEALFRDATQYSNSDKGVLWWLIVRAPKSTPTIWSERVVREIEAIDYADNAEMVLPHFPGIEESLAPRFLVYFLARVARIAKSEGLSFDDLGLRATARSIFESMKPRGFRIVQWLIDFVWFDKDGRATDPTYQLAEKVRLQELDKVRERQDALRERDAEPSDWVTIEKSPFEDPGD